MDDIKKKVKVFRGLFTGLPHVYGTFDPNSGRSAQMKALVTDKVIADHINGKQAYGVYLLVHDKTRAVVVDFDTHNKFAPTKFISRAKQYGIPAYIERSKSKGYHAWIFFDEMGVLAKKARSVVRHILDEIDEPETEIFPKQNRLTTNLRYGNFINTPLFGALVPRGRTVFVDPYTFKPYPDQWNFLETIHRINQSTLDNIIELNALLPVNTQQFCNSKSGSKINNRHSLPPCAQKMLANGVSHYQRVSCFRLAVHLKRLGLPYDLAVAALQVWACKNRPIHGKRIIKVSEINSQTSYAYKNTYMGYGCDSPAIEPYCDPSCHVKQSRRGRK